MLITFIEFCNGSTTPEKENVRNDMKHILHCIAMKKFTGQANVYVGGDKMYSMTCQEGNLNGQFIKYCDYKPSTWSGLLSGYISRNWRQPEMEINMRSGLIDGQVVLYGADGYRRFLLNWSMGILQGEQKHYTTDITRIVHTFEIGKWVKSVKQYKNWLPRWGIELDEVASHKEIKTVANEINGLFNR